EGGGGSEIRVPERRGASPGAAAGSVGDASASSAGAVVVPPAESAFTGVSDSNAAKLGSASNTAAFGSAFDPTTLESSSSAAALGIANDSVNSRDASPKRRNAKSARRTTRQGCIASNYGPIRALSPPAQSGISRLAEQPGARGNQHRRRLPPSGARRAGQPTPATPAAERSRAVRPNTEIGRAHV